MHYLLSYHSRSDEQISSQITARRARISEKQNEYAPLLKAEQVLAEYNHTLEEQVLERTDGITEAENIHGEQYGLERLCEILQRHWSQPAQMIKELLIKDLYTFIGEQKIFDDITLLVIKQQSEPYIEQNVQPLFDSKAKEYMPFLLN